MRRVQGGPHPGRKRAGRVGANPRNMRDRKGVPCEVQFTLAARGPSGLSAGKEAREAKPCRLLPFPKPHPSSKPPFLEPPPQLGRAPPCTPGTKRKRLFCTPKRATVQSAGGCFCKLCSCICPSHVVLHRNHPLREIRPSGMSSARARCGPLRSTLVPALTTHRFGVTRGTSKVLEQHLSTHKIIREHFLKRAEH